MEITKNIFKHLLEGADYLYVKNHIQDMTHTSVSAKIKKSEMLRGVGYEYFLFAHNDKTYYFDNFKELIEFVKDKI